jgi:hypothetical protein
MQAKAKEAKQQGNRAIAKETKEGRKTKKKSWGSNQPENNKIS